MASPVNFEGTNKIFHKPENMSEEECGSLHVLRTREESIGCACLISCWEFTEKEKEEIAKTGKVWVKVLGEVASPISISGDGFNEVEIHRQLAKEGKTYA